MTADAMVEDRERSLKSGMNDHVTKPVDPGQLQRVLVRWLAPSISEQTPVQPEHTAPQWKLQDRYPDQLPGIDLREGVKRFMDDHDVYFQVLEHVYKNRMKEMEKLKQAFRGEDYATARFLVHRLKGMAGNISASQMYEAAAELDNALLEGRNHQAESLQNELEEAMQEVLNGLEMLFESAEAEN